MSKGKQIINILASILFIIMELMGFIFTYVLLFYALDINFTRFTVAIMVAMGALSTWGIFAYLGSKGDSDNGQA